MSRRIRMAEKKMTWISWAAVSLFGIAFLGMFGVMAHRAYWTVKIDSPEWKTRFREDFPGMDKAASLPLEKRKHVVEQANKEFCPCKCGYTLAGCLKDDRSCPLRAKNLDRLWELILQASIRPQGLSPAQ
jgi:hypothetical protein